MNFRTVCIACVLALAGLAPPVQAETSILDAIAGGRPVIDLRGRYETNMGRL